jgi:hypothetical protein
MERDTSVIPELVVFAAALCVLVIIPLRLLRFFIFKAVFTVWRLLIWVRCELYYWWGTLGS